MRLISCCLWPSVSIHYVLEDVNQQMVITKRYLDGETWEQIAVDMDMALRSVHKLHGQALPILELMLFDNEGSEADVNDEAHDSNQSDN